MSVPGCAEAGGVGAVTTQEPAALGDVVSAGLSAIAKPSIMRIPN
jgi:hypothetical protein